MSHSYSKLFGAFALAAMSAVACAQTSAGWGSFCFDRKNTQPLSTDFSEQWQGDSLFQGVLGISGTVTYGGTPSTTDDPPCFHDGVTANTVGRFGFGIGNTGSIQSTFDDDLPVTMGFPFAGGSWGYAALTLDSKTDNGQPASTRTRFGSSGFTTTFVGASDRYIFAEEVQGNTTIDLRMDFVGDACRLQWLLTNEDTAAQHTLGLWFGLWPAMSDAAGDTSGFSGGGGIGAVPPLNATPASVNKNGYIFIPGVIPPTTEQRYIRGQSTQSFPQYVDFCFGQTQAYGLRIENGPNQDTEDATGANSDATQADEFALGQAYFLLSAPLGGDYVFPDVMFGVGNTGGDVTYVDDPGFIQKYYEQPVGSGSSRTIVQYLRSTWGVSNYFRPYSVVLDAPTLIPTDLTQTSGLAAGNGPNGSYQIGVVVDNTRGFSTADQSQELDNVVVTLKLPAGLSLASGETSTKIIPKVQPGSLNLSTVTFDVVPDGISFGPLTYSVTVSPTPGPTKTLTGVITVAATPKLTISSNANFVTTPWTFSDASWETILGLVEGQDFQAYNWDPILNGYVISSSATRGVATWIVATNNIGIRSLQGNPTVPSDVSSGVGNQTLQPGWNAIGNPYPYGIQVGQIIGATNASPNSNFKWDDLVSQGFVNGAIAYYNPTTQAYQYLQNDTDVLEPNTGYWLYVGVQSPLTIKMPPVYAEFLPASDRSSNTTWTQADNQWRLQLSARSATSVDPNNYIGVVGSASSVTKLQMAKPPTLPSKTAGVSLAIAGTVNGKTTRMAQALTTSATKQQFTVSVTAPQAGDVTLTWPNISTIPKTVQVRLVDNATGATRVMNSTSGYTFTATAGSTRTFTVQLQTATASRAMIGNVVVSRTTKSPNSPVAISYTLGSASTTTIQILNSAGSTIYTLVAGRSDAVGTNSAVWNLRDSANRAVAPGSYKVVISASASDGSTSHKTQVINIVR